MTSHSILLALLGFLALMALATADYHPCFRRPNLATLSNNGSLYQCTDGSLVLKGCTLTPEQQKFNRTALLLNEEVFHRETIGADRENQVFTIVYRQVSFDFDEAKSVSDVPWISKTDTELCWR